MVRCLEWSQEDRRPILDWISNESGVSLQGQDRRMSLAYKVIENGWGREIEDTYIMQEVSGVLD